MRHPSEYVTFGLAGMHIMVVDAGTVVTDERSGQSATIDDQNAVAKGRLIYCTERTFEALKAVATPKDTTHAE